MRLVLQAMVLAVALALAIAHPSLGIVALAVWVWVLWPAYAGRRGTHARTARVAVPRPSTVRFRYLGGHPSLPPGRGVLRVWPVDGGALLRIGREEVAFPLSAVRAVTLIEGRVGLRTGLRGFAAYLVGRALAIGRGRFCGMRPHQEGDQLVVIDRSRVLCELERDDRVYRLVLTGPRGGGEEIYLETLMALRPAAVRPETAAGGGTGATAWPRP